ncbi:HNH endonuclease [Halomonas maura]|uniref:HNH endonuclease n=1 Tax=Halomonas maura TaxID=117606 RepID=UPI0025B33603|nr:HNH endonuclease [Halomonas maura]MDN3558138.1 HNH endonuclease [Halomonas maura]
MKRRTRLQWYKYHLEQSQKSAIERVQSKYEPKINRLRSFRDQLKEDLNKAKEHESFVSKLLSVFGKETLYRQNFMVPIEKNIDRVVEELQRLVEQRSKDVKEAAEKGKADYLESHASRKKEAEERAERVANQKYEKRLRYLEKSTALRSASKTLKEHLLKEKHQSGEVLSCYYCGKRIAAEKSHLEHKRPLSRGGTNRRSNLTIACASCNLSKGNKTDKEFFRHGSHREN